VRAGDRLDVTPHTIDPEGDGVGNHDGVKVRVPGLFPEEAGVVRVLATSRHRPEAHAALLSVVTPHPERRVAPCHAHTSRGGWCSGCALMPLSEPAQRALKARLLRERYGLEVSEVRAAPQALGYRYAGKRVALSHHKRLLLGSYVRGSHEPASMDGCLVDHPLLVSAFESVASAARAIGLAPFDPATGRGELRHVWGKTNGEVSLVTLVVRKADAGWVKPLAAALPEGLGVFVSEHDGQGNTMRGSAPVHLRGPREACVTLLGEPVNIDALGFLQPNPAVAAAAYEALIDLRDVPGPHTLAYDLYAGVGFTTRALARRFTRVEACEAYGPSARELGVAPLTSEAFLAQRVAEEGPRPELVVANPPRKGLGSEVVASLRALGAPRLHIMSCGPEGLARDLAGLCAPGGYRLVELVAFDTLPQTPHLELVAKLTR
jgi:23S rRNA (uracil1939-C5)-methyltransferase